MTIDGAFRARVLCCHLWLVAALLLASNLSAGAQRSASK